MGKKGGKVELRLTEVGQRPERKLSLKIGGCYKVQAPLNILTCHLNCSNCQLYGPIRDGSLSTLPNRRHEGEALSIQIIQSDILNQI